MFSEKVKIIHLLAELIKYIEICIDILSEMSQYFSKSFERYGGNVKYE